MEGSLSKKTERFRPVHKEFMSNTLFVQRPPIIYKAQDGFDQVGADEYPSEGQIGWRENEVGDREMVRWDVQFGAWLNRKAVTALHNEIGSVTPPWEEPRSQENEETRVGLVFESEKGDKLAEESFLNTGWLQTVSGRVRVTYRRRSHNFCAWTVDDNEN